MSDHPWFDQFTSELHQQWRQDRALRQRIPLNESWRGCLGIAAMLQNVRDTLSYGDRSLIENDNVRWLCLRDIPLGHWRFANGGEREAAVANPRERDVRSREHRPDEIDPRRTAAPWRNGGSDRARVPAEQSPADLSRSPG